MLNLGCDFRKCAWVSKSAIEEREIGENENGGYNYPTLFTSNYDEAVAAFKSHWVFYR